MLFGFGCFSFRLFSWFWYVWWFLYALVGWLDLLVHLVGLGGWVGFAVGLVG